MFKVATLAAAASAEIYFKESFDGAWEERWVTSDWKKGDGAGEFAVTAGEFFGDAEADKGLKTTQDAKFYDISAKFPEFSNKDKTLVIQFSVKHAQKLDCGGGYVKVFPAGLDQTQMSGDSAYNIMFGPDMCGSSTKKVHVIFENKGTNHLIKKSIACETDQLTHVYTLIVNPDNTYEVQVDGAKKEGGSLEEDWSILPEKKIKDPEQSKPDDWVNSAKMADPESVKPEGYDDIAKQLSDPDAEKPADWDDEDDGEWEAPMVDNPEYKGPWKQNQIDNPDYKGPWVHPEIDNPEYAADSSLYSYPSFGAIGIDIWQVKSGSIFDNIIITDSVAEAASFLAETWTNNKDAEKASFDAFQAAKKEKEDAERAAADAERAASAGDEDEDEEEEEEAPKEEL
jgi:calreticulin